MSRREPMTPISGLKKPALPAPSPRPRTLTPVPEPTPDPLEEQPESVTEGPSFTPAQVDAPAAEARSGATARAGRPRKPRAERQAQGRSASADTMKAVSVSVPLTVAEAWRDTAKRDRTSQVDVLLDALVARQDELTGLVAARAEQPTVSDGLFDRTPGAKGERFVGVSLRIKSGNLQVIDQLVDKHGAESRSQLVAAALSAHLG